ncbi:hypothetical protein, partial [Sphingobium sp. MK2]|uniref:hypothetical protein n=1 Tax=Sphingobium sp. MK2 TaxID=3116540 RepID=UPI0032E35948
PGNTSPCHHSLHLFAKRCESQHAGITQQLSVRALKWQIVLGAGIEKQVLHQVDATPRSKSQL